MTPERFSETLFAIQGCSLIQGPVELTAGFLRRAEAAIGKHGFDIFAGVSGDRDFKIVDRGRTVERKRRGVTPVHEIDQDRRQAAFYDVAAESPEDHFLAGASVRQCIDDGAQRIGRQDMRKRIKQCADAATRVGPSKMVDTNFSAARLNGDGL